MQEMHVTFLQAAIISIWVAMVMSRGLGGATLTLRFTPMMTGLIVGIVFNDIPNAMITTAAIQLIYMGVFSPGGQMPSEPAIATAVAVPVALLGKMEPTAAVAVAVPVGLLGSYLYQLRFFFNTMIMKLTEKYAEEANSRGLTFSIIVLPIICSFALFVPLMFVALYFGAPIIADVIQSNAGGLVFHILKVIGIIGCGNIGSRVAEIFKHGFNARLLVVDPKVNVDWANKNNIEIVELDYLLQNADIISLNASLNETSYHILKAPQFSLMKKGVYITNTARAELIDETALLNALDNGTVAGHATDVMYVEPSYSDHPLVKHPKVLVTPHTSAYAIECLQGMGEKCVQDVENFVNNLELQSVVS